MANHKSAIKRIRQSNTRRLRNKYYHTSMRSAIRKLRLETDKEVAAKKLPEVSSMIDRVAKRGIIHDNKAANLKSKLAKHINSL